MNLGEVCLVTAIVSNRRCVATHHVGEFAVSYSATAVLRVLRSEHRSRRRGGGSADLVLREEDSAETLGALSYRCRWVPLPPRDSPVQRRCGGSMLRGVTNRTEVRDWRRIGMAIRLSYMPC
jgi:hypothetical protein